MKHPPFTYHRPDTVDEAVELLAELGDDAKVLAGGQSLLPLMALRLGRPAHLVDIGRIGALDRIEVAADGAVSIGALVRHADAERSAALASAAPLVHLAMPHVGHRAIRNRGTVCGSVAHADPAAEMPAVCLAAGAVLIARSTRGVREIAAGDFFAGYLQTALEPDELLVELRLPPWPSGARAAVVEVARRHGDYALVGLAARIELDDEGVVTDAALAFFGVWSTPVRAEAAAEALVGRRLDDASVADAVAAVTGSLSPTGDVHASAAHRRHLAGVLTRRALAAAASTPQHGESTQQHGEEAA